MPEIAIVGTGFSGLAAAIALKKAGFERFTIYEKAASVGGTWRENTYPGAECDVASSLYSFSFALNSRWPSKWSHQHAILEYIENVVDDFGLRPHIRFETEVLGADWDEAEAVWRVRTSDGPVRAFQYLVCATGQLSRPRIPDIPGLDTFQGEKFHSACWNHDYDMTGRRVGVIGNAASAVQFVPEIAPLAERVRVFQRSANWIFRKPDRDYTELEKWLGAHLPLLLRLYRLRIWLFGELLLYPLMANNRRMQEKARQQTLDFLAEEIDDPELREKLVPDYPIGAKRVLFTNNYYETLNRDDVDLITTPIERVGPAEIVTRDGVEHAVDAIVLATGFQTNDFLAPMEIVGRKGVSLNEAWRGGAEAYLGVTVSGFPNLFILYGPNTNLGHNSILIMSECQARYLVDCVRKAEERGARAIDVKPEVQSAYNEEIQTRLRRMAWATVEDSWYMRDGKVTNNWPGRTSEYWRRTRKADLDLYDVA